MELHEIIQKIKIEDNQEYYDDLLKHEKINKVINDVLKWYKYNKEDVRDIICIAIYEYVAFEYNFADSFNEIKFLDSLKRKVSFKTKKIVNGTYKSKEIPFDSIDKVSNLVDLSLDAVEEKIDFQLAIKTLNDREKIIFKLYYLDGLNQSEIADKLKLTQPMICMIQKEIIKKIKKFFEIDL